MIFFKVKYFVKRFGDDLRWRKQLCYGPAVVKAGLVWTRCSLSRFVVVHAAVVKIGFVWIGCEESRFVVHQLW